MANGVAIRRHNARLSEGVTEVTCGLPHLPASNCGWSSKIKTTNKLGARFLQPPHPLHDSKEKLIRDPKTTNALQANRGVRKAHGSLDWRPNKEKEKKKKRNQVARALDRTGVARILMASQNLE